MQNSQCPVCSSDIIIDDDAYEGDLIDCANCGAEIEIISLRPLQLKEIAPDETDDWSDEDENE
jgi:alpha-aminoadipate/glutamate carrier protein LysW